MVSARLIELGCGAHWRSWLGRLAFGWDHGRAIAGVTAEDVLAAIRFGLGDLALSEPDEEEPLVLVDRNGVEAYLAVAEQIGGMVEKIGAENTDVPLAELLTRTLDHAGSA